MKTNKYSTSNSVFLCALILLATLSAPSARAEHTRMTNPNVIGLEVLGRALMYSINFDRVLSDDLVAGIGYGSTTLQDLSGNSTGNSTSMVPIYMNYYFMRDAGSVFVTGGATLSLSSDQAKDFKATYSGLQFSSTPVVPNFGLGYENRGDAGFLFRIAGYGIIGKSLNPWLGFTIGYAF